MKGLNVLYIVGGEGHRYGSETIAIELLSAAQANGIRYTVICANKGAVSEECERLGVKYFVAPFKFYVYKKPRSFILNCIKKAVWRVRADFLTARAVRFIENNVDIGIIDIIHTNLSRDLLGGLLSRKYGIPHVWHIQELFRAHYQLTFLRSDQINWMSDHADKFVAISNTVAKDWISEGLPTDKVCVIKNGIELSCVSQKKQFDPSAALKLVMVGHLVPAKGQEQVIRCLSRLPDEIQKNITLDCIGDGETAYKDHLRRYASECGVNMRLCGYRSDICNILKDYDIGINYSAGEGFGLTTVEYMAAGLCPIVANTGANTELVDDKENGFVFDFSSEDSFDSLITYLYNNRDVLSSVANNATKKAFSEFDVDRMCRQVFKLYDQLACMDRK